MLTFILILNILFLILSVIFFIKTRGDIEEVKKSKNIAELDEISMRVLALEERVSSLEKELREKELSELRKPEIKSETKQNTKESIRTPPDSSPSHRSKPAKTTENLIIDLINQGKKEEEIANITGKSVEEIKLMLKIYKNR